MAKAQLGTKRQCQSCGARFYDLSRDPITCPKCSTVFVVEAPTRPRRPRAAADANGAAKAKPKPAPVPEDEAVEGELEEAASDEAEEEFIEDASELGEDEDDMAEVIENVEEEEP